MRDFEKCSRSERRCTKSEGSKLYWLLPTAAHDDLRRCLGAVIGEELGFLGLLFLITCYLLLLWRGFHIAKNARNAFSMFLASAITLMLVMEAGFNLGVVLGILPPKGLVLPFISYGSSALMANLWAIGLLLSISAEKRDIPLEQGWKINKESA